MSRRKRFVLILAASLVGVVLVAALALPALIDVNRYRDTIEAAAEEFLGRDVRLGDMRLTVLPSLGIRVDDLAIGALPDEGPGDLLTARRLRVGVRLLPLLGKRLELTSLVIQEPALTLERRADGTWNVQQLVAAEGFFQFIDG